MAWSTATNTVGTYSFYLQRDTGWIVRPNVVKHTPIGAYGSIHHLVGTPSETRIITGYMLSASNRASLRAAAAAGTAVAYDSEQCYIQEMAGERTQAENEAYVDLVTITLSRQKAP